MRFESSKRIGVPQEFSVALPFPGPGLAVRIIGDVTEDKIDLSKAADRILDGVRRAELYNSVWQAFQYSYQYQPVGVMGDERTYERVIGHSSSHECGWNDADWARLPHDLLARVSARLFLKSEE